MTTKICTQCGEDKDLTEYQKHSTSSDGKTWECRECTALRGRKRYKNKKYPQPVAFPETKVCSTCGEEKPPSAYYKDQHYPDHRQKQCRACRLNVGRASRFGITVSELTDFVNDRGNKCEVCGSSEGNMHLDHSHDTGKIRGLLCHGCNVSLGLVKEDPETLRGLANYIERTTHEHSNLSGKDPLKRAHGGS